MIRLTRAVTVGFHASQLTSSSSNVKHVRRFFAEGKISGLICRILVLSKI